MLITPPEILKKTGANNNLDQGSLLPSIELAELRFLTGADCLGFDFYSSMVAEKNQTVTPANIVSLQALFNAQALQPNAGKAPTLELGMIVNAAEFLSANNRAFWDAFLWKYVAECVVYMAMVDNYIKFDSAGLMKNNPIGSALGTETSTTVGASLQDVKYLQEKYMRERLEPLRTNLRRYLSTNGVAYPIWSRNQAQAPAKMTGYTDLSIYRDEDEGGGCGCTWQGNNPQFPGRDLGPHLNQ